MDIAFPDGPENRVLDWRGVQMKYLPPSSIAPGDVLLRIHGHQELCRLEHIARTEAGHVYHFPGFALPESALLKFFKTSPDGKSLEVC